MKKKTRKTKNRKVLLRRNKETRNIENCHVAVVKTVHDSFFVLLNPERKYLFRKVLQETKYVSILETERSDR